MSRAAVIHMGSVENYFSIANRKLQELEIGSQIKKRFGTAINSNATKNKEKTKYYRQT